MKNEEDNLLNILSSTSADIEKLTVSLQQQRVTREKFIEAINRDLVKVTFDSINAYFLGNELALKEFINFYTSLVQRFISEHESLSYMLPTDFRYVVAENVVASVYIFSAYLLKIDKLGDAEKVLAQQIKGSLKNHYVARTVFTLRSRAGVKREYRGWCIGIAEAIYTKNKRVQSLFFHNHEQYLDLICQADFLQYYVEFQETKDVYHGYPNFLYYNKERVMPLIDKLRNANNESELDNLISELPQITSGDFFLENQWSYD